MHITSVVPLADDCRSKVVYEQVDKCLEGPGKQVSLLANEGDTFLLAIAFLVASAPHLQREKLCLSVETCDDLLLWILTTLTDWPPSNDNRRSKQPSFLAVPILCSQ